MEVNLCSICKKSDAYSDSGMCLKCGHNAYIDLIVDSCVNNNRQGHIKHILGILYDNAYMNGRVSAASDLAKRFNLGRIEKISKDEIIIEPRLKIVTSKRYLNDQTI